MEQVPDFGFMNYVAGIGGPRKVHADFETALGEAKRLASVSPTRNVYILAAIDVIEATQEKQTVKVEVKKKKRIVVLPDVTV